MTHAERLDSQEHRLAELEAISRTRPLDRLESRELERLEHNRCQRLRRIHQQIATAEAKLARLRRLAAA